MRALCLHDVPDEVVERLERLAARDGISVAAVAVRELADVSRRADNLALLGSLEDLGVDPAEIVDGIEARPIREIMAMSTETLESLREHLADVIDRVEHGHERVTITRDGRVAAVLISPDDLAGLEETISVRHDPEALADIREADAAYARGDVVRGVESVRRLNR